MKHIEFNNSSATKIYNNYLNQIRKHSQQLDHKDQEELLMEFNSHIFEAIQNQEGTDEVEKLLVVLERLGEPVDTLIPMVADKKLKQATRTYNPKHIAQALSLNIKQSFTFAFFGLGYLLVSVLLLLIPAKIILPNQTGLFFSNNEFVSFGINSNTEGYTEILGFWLIPIVLLAAAIIYFGTTSLMRLLKKT